MVAAAVREGVGVIDHALKRLKCFASPKWCYRVSNNLGTYGREDMVKDLTLDPYGGLGVDPLTMRRSDLNPSQASRYVER